VTFSNTRSLLNKKIKIEGSDGNGGLLERKITVSNNARIILYSGGYVQFRSVFIDDSANTVDDSTTKAFVYTGGYASAGVGNSGVSIVGSKYAKGMRPLIKAEGGFLNAQIAAFEIVSAPTGSSELIRTGSYPSILQLAGITNTAGITLYTSAYTDNRNLLVAD